VQGESVGIEPKLGQLGLIDDPQDFADVFV
jgi:hypothetical protein